MATRVYVRSEGTPDITPSSWNFTNQINPVSLPGTLIKNSGSPMTSKTEATGTTNPTARAMGRTIIGPLKAQTINGTIKGQMRGSESNAGANATLALAVKVIQPDGTDRGVLLAQTASDSATAGNELVTSLTNATFKNASEVAAIPLSSVASSDGDYIVIEWGFRSATGTTRNITLSYGNDSATDLPEDTSTTAANNPWFEFSTTLNLVHSFVGSSDGAGAASATSATIASATASASGVASSSVTTSAFTDSVMSGGGASSAEGASAIVITATGSSEGAATGEGVGAAVVSSVSSADGTVSCIAISLSTSTATASSEGLSTGSGIGTTIVNTVGESTGAASTGFSTASISACQAAGTGNSLTVFEASEIYSTIGVSSGMAEALGVFGEEGSIASAAGAGSTAFVAAAFHSSTFSVSGTSTGSATATSVMHLVADVTVSVPAQNFTAETVVQNHESNLVAGRLFRASVPPQNFRVKA